MRVPPAAFACVAGDLHQCLAPVAGDAVRLQHQRDLAEPGAALAGFDAGDRDRGAADPFGHLFPRQSGLLAESSQFGGQPTLSHRGASPCCHALSPEPLRIVPTTKLK